jgi:D-glycero-D-manno-heptose 1,7-bisphosphate phosphatase
MGAGRVPGAGARALLLDRDGTLIEDVGYPRDPERVVLLPGAAPALRKAAARGFRLVIVSNQSGVARGLVSPEDAARVQARVAELFAEEGVRFHGAYFCFHGPDDGCACRKPAPGMLLRAAAELELSLGASVMVGDKPSDIAAGKAAGAASVLFGGASAKEADAAFETWDELSTWLETR